MANEETSNPGSSEKAGQGGKPYLNKNYKNNFRRKANWWHDTKTLEEGQRLTDRARRGGDSLLWEGVEMGVIDKFSIETGQGR